MFSKCHHFIFMCFEFKGTFRFYTIRFVDNFYFLPPKLQMQRPDVRANQNVPHGPPHQPWGPPQGFPAPGPVSGGGPAFPPNPQYMPPSHNYDNYYPPADLPPMDKHLHQGPAPAYGRDTSMGIHSSSVQPQQSVVTKVSFLPSLTISERETLILKHFFFCGLYDFFCTI